MELSSGAAPAYPGPSLASLISPLGASLATSPAYAAESGVVGDPGETHYSSEEVETLRLINDYRQENGLQPLGLSDTVSTASARYAHDMAKYDAYRNPEAHITGPSDYYPEGADLTVRMNAEGYEAPSYGENIAAGQETAGEVFEAWRASPGHNAMMLNPEMTTVGIGLVENPNTSYGEFWATNFGNEADETTRPVSEAESGNSGGSGVPVSGRQPTARERRETRRPSSPCPRSTSTPTQTTGAPRVRAAAPTRGPTSWFRTTCRSTP